MKVGAEARRTTADLERQNEHYEAIRKKIAEVRQAQEEFRKQAAIMPEFFGRPGGTAEDVQTLTTPNCPSTT
jgi:hypothetical protein